MISFLKGLQAVTFWGNFAMPSPSANSDEFAPPSPASRRWGCTAQNSVRLF